MNRIIHMNPTSCCFLLVAILVWLLLAIILYCYLVFYTAVFPSVQSTAVAQQQSCKAGLRQRGISYIRPPTEFIIWHFKTHIPFQAQLGQSLSIFQKIVATSRKDAPAMPKYSMHRQKATQARWSQVSKCPRAKADISSRSALNCRAIIMSHSPSVGKEAEEN